MYVPRGNSAKSDIILKLTALGKPRNKPLVCGIISVGKFEPSPKTRSVSELWVQEAAEQSLPRKNGGGLFVFLLGKFET